MQAPVGVAQRQIDEAVIDDLVLAQGQRLKRAGHDVGRSRIAHELLALLDYRLGERLGEFALWHNELVRRTIALLACLVTRDERHAHLEPSPRMGRQILRSASVDTL